MANQTHGQKERFGQSMTHSSVQTLKPKPLQKKTQTQDFLGI